MMTKEVWEVCCSVARDSHTVPHFWSSWICDFLGGRENLSLAPVLFVSLARVFGATRRPAGFRKKSENQNLKSENLR